MRRNKYGEYRFSPFSYKAVIKVALIISELSLHQ